jgi:glycosyltransferase involved in cell wall biosynthesis
VAEANDLSTPEIALLHQQYGPYHVARAHALHRRTGGRARFIQLASREEMREWRTDGPTPEILTIAEGALEQIASSRLARGVSEQLDRLRPGAVIIAGYAHPAMRAAARWCRSNGAASILLSDSNHVDHRRNPLKEWVKRAWVSRHFDAAFVAGALSAAYAQSLGFAPSQVWRGYDVVDNDFFASAAAARARQSSLLQELNLPERVFLFVGRLSAEKNVHRLVDAMAEYRRRAGAWGLLLVGSGPESEAIASRARSMPGTVALVGFKQLADLAKIYATAGALILPSTSEPWGLVVNEAMAAGLPVLVSDRAGSASDLVFPGVNGYVFNPLATEAMVEVMLRVSSEDVDLKAMGLASQRIIANYTPETWATALTDAVEVTLRRRARG